MNYPRADAAQGKLMVVFPNRPFGLGTFRIGMVKRECWETVKKFLREDARGSGHVAHVTETIGTPFFDFVHILQINF